MTSRCHFWLVALALLGFGCNRGAKPAVASGPSSPPGWEVRYNATIALARRGSERIKDEQVWENLQEMLDEEQQLRNSRRKVKDGAEVPDEAGARITVITALQAIDELHRKRPEMDLSGLTAAVEQLTRSSNMAVSTEARKTQQLLTQK